VVRVGLGGAALTLPYLNRHDTATKTIGAFATMTMKQHTEHGQAFNARVVGAGREEADPDRPQVHPDRAGHGAQAEEGRSSDPKVRVLFGTVAGGSPSTWRPPMRCRRC
jgi:hypothetical protein